MLPRNFEFMRSFPAQKNRGRIVLPVILIYLISVFGA